MAQKISYWLLITLVLSLGFGQLLRFNLFGLPIYLHDILVIFILATQVRNIVIPTYLKVFFVGLGLSSLRALFLYPLSLLAVPSLYMFRLLAYLALYVLLQKSKLSIPKVIFLFAGLATLVIGLAQYIYLPDMRVFQYLGWDDHLSRLTLPHYDPTFTAIMLSLAMLSFTHFAPIFMLGILLSYSRSVWLSLALTAATFIKSKHIILLVISAMLFAIIALPERFGEGTNLLRTYSITSRITSDFDYLTRYKWDLLLGRGLNTLPLDTPDSQYENHATGPNNSYLYLLVTTGVLGLVGWGVFMKYLYSTSSFKPMLLFFFISSIFNNVMFYPFALLWVLLVEFRVPTSD